MDATVSLYQYQSALAQEVNAPPDAVSSQMADKFQAMLSKDDLEKVHQEERRTDVFVPPASAPSIRQASADREATLARDGGQPPVEESGEFFQRMQYPRM